MSFEIIEVTPENIDKVGFFCFMSKRNTTGYARKLAWVKQRLAEGMHIQFCNSGGGRGFIEYIPGEYAWRAINASKYMVIHCIWNVGKSRGTGLAQELLKQCEEDTRKQGLDGVAMVTSQGNWLIHSRFLEGQGYQSVEQAPPSFNLMVKKFHPATSPTFCGHWERKQSAFGDGLVLVRSDQCPYVDGVASTLKNATNELKMPFKDICLQSAVEVREKAPCAYGTNALLYNGKLLTYTWVSKEKLVELKNQ
jgi:hypothetical protein